MRFFRSFFLFSGISALLAPMAAHAAQALPFGAQIGASSQKNLDAYFQSGFQSGTPAPRRDIALAPVDLNEDGLPEFIARDRACDSGKGPCRFEILAENDDKIILLGEIPAYNIALGNGYSAGVRNLIAYENASNDYDYSVYVWEAGKARYMMKKQK